MSALLVFNQREFAASEQHRFESLLLADELRQSSNDLTRLARAYVSTTDTVFEQYFYDVLAIRDGMKQRPENYNAMYWDFVLATGNAPVPDGLPISLEQLMLEKDFTIDELNKLEESKSLSDALVQLEEKAMNATKGLFDDGSGLYTIVKQPDLAMARQIMYSNEYHIAKAAIMEPIYEFYVMIDARTAQEVDDLRKTGRVYASVIIGLTSVSLAFTFYTFLLLHRRVILPVRRLVEAANEVESGQYRKIVEYSVDDELGDLSSAFNHMTLAIEQDISRRENTKAILAKAKLAAENANRSKSEFLSHMSHELRTPLNGVLGYAQILQRDSTVTSDQRESLNAIESCGSHLLALINDVLDLSRIEAGRIEVEETPCDLSKLIKSVINIVEQRAMSKGVTCTTEISPEVPQGVCIDEAKVRQILINLLGNSVKFTAEGGVVLAVAEQPKGQLCFEVSDTGVGMTQEELEDIFDPFKQLDAGKTAGGTGLGLAICHRLIDAMHGTIAVTSEKNLGTTFTVRLPLVEADTEDMSILDSQGAIDYGVMVLAPGETCTVLVVDDRETNRDILDRMLTAAGITSLIADDGDTALEMMRSHPEIDLVLMDVRMPRLNGIDAVGQIRADESLRDTKVIAVTASVFPEFRMKAIESGFDDFLGKPFRTEEMLQKIRTHLKIHFNEANHFTESEDSSVPTTKLTAALSLEVAERIRDAVKLGNVTALNALVAELERNHNAASLGRRISDLTRAFNFEGLESVATDLSEDSET